MKINASPFLDNLTTLDALKRFITVFSRNVQEAVNGNLSFSDNFNAVQLSVTFSGSGVDTVVEHQLDRVPVGYLVLRSTSPLIVYDGSQPTRVLTKTFVTLRASASGQCTLLLF